MPIDQNMPANAGNPLRDHVEQFMTTWAIGTAHLQRQPQPFYRAVAVLLDDSNTHNNLAARVLALEAVETTMECGVKSILTPHALKIIQAVIERDELLKQCGI